MAKTIPLDRLRHISKQRPLRKPDALERHSDLPARGEPTDLAVIEWPLRS
jgi:hypothetical protein